MLLFSRGFGDTTIAEIHAMGPRLSFFVKGKRLKHRGLFSPGQTETEEAATADRPEPGAVGQTHPGGIVVPGAAANHAPAVLCSTPLLKTTCEKMAVRKAVVWAWDACPIQLCTLGLISAQLTAPAW
jgi:hypothetical protein